MRSQAEILTMIDKVVESKVDPSGIQQTALIHKLTWENAQIFIKPEQKTEEFKKSWDRFSKLDKEALLKELEDQVDYTWMVISDKDQNKSIVSFQIIFVIIWLLGNRYDKFLGQVQFYFFKTWQVDLGADLLKKICEEMGFNWRLLERRYPKRPDSGLILPDHGPLG